jgi:hypothetical protein
MPIGSSSRTRSRAGWVAHNVVVGAFHEDGHEGITAGGPHETAGDDLGPNESPEQNSQDAAGPFSGR